MNALKTGFALAFAASLLAAGPASAALITSQGALSSNDSIGWSQLGPAFTVLPPSSPVLSVGGLSAVLSTTGAHLERRDQGNGWSGNFTPGDALIWTEQLGPDITITFLNPVFGFGAQVQSDSFGAFTAQVTLSNGDIFTLDGNSTSSADGSAIFIGALDGLADISSVRFALTAAPSNTINDFAIDTLFLRTGPVVAGVPEPMTLSLFGAGILGAVAMRRRRNKSA